MEYVKNLNTDEIRSGFLVTSDRKRLWNALINLIIEFQKLCDKHGLRFMAHAGTLLGAARHGGFIPWDDDVDLIMPRKDYERLKILAPKEIRYPYRYYLWYDNDDPDYADAVSAGFTNRRIAIRRYLIWFKIRNAVPILQRFF